jgi:predicted nucleic acid-binding Zn ribbon protein
MQRHCWLCGKSYEPRRSHSRFCSPNCRLKDWRERNREPKPWSETLIKRYQTKHSQIHLAICCQCNRSYFINGAQKMSMYCSAACRNKAHRESKEYKRAARQLELWGYQGK